MTTGGTGLDLAPSEYATRTRAVARALELREAGDDDWLDVACAESPELRTYVESVVASVDDVSDLVRGLGTRSKHTDELIVGRYRLERRIGAGAMGVVYSARDLELQRDVALKLLDTQLVEPRRASSRFDREARALAAIDHDAVVTIHDRGETARGEKFIVMDRVEGGALSELVPPIADTGDEPASVERAVVTDSFELDFRPFGGYVRWAAGAVAELASGVAAAHREGVIHRDIKPSNVLVRRDAKCVLIDFGIARVLDGSELTQGGSTVGTPAFMAPECTASGRRASVASDVYGLSALLYYLLALRPPYQGTPIEVLARLGRHEPAPLGKLRPGLPKDLVAIVEQGMSRAPGARYATAEALEGDLRAFLGHRPVQARTIGPVHRSVRRAMRSTVGRTVATLVAASAVVAGGIAWSDARTAAKQAAWLEAFRGLPPNFTLIDPASRASRFDADRASLSARLDEAVRHRPDEWRTRLLRAAHRIDHGDVRGAAEDMRAVARTVGTPYAAALARAFEEAREGSVGAASVDDSHVPEPRTLEDRFLFAYREARLRRDVGAAIDALTPEVVDAVPGAFELRRSITGLANGRDAMFAAYEELLAYEARLGATTAWSRHWIAFVLGRMRNYRASYAAALESVALAPRSHVNRTNAGFHAYVLGRRDEARGHVETGLELAPTHEKSLSTLVWTYVRDRDFDGANLALDEFAAPFDEERPGLVDEWRGVVEVYRALDAREHRSDDDPSAAVEAATRSAESWFERARDAGRPATPKVARTLLDALEADDPEALVVALAASCEERPDAWWRLDLLRRHAGDAVDPTGALRPVLARTIDHLATVVLADPSDE